ncbi:MAG: hypothetical protein F4X76_00160 [Chloroflexi bacterium]|nr:hypothetical protein [Chloroflexota bacterium]
MRWILILLGLLIVAAIAAAVWALAAGVVEITMDEARDTVIIVYGLLGIVFFLIAIVAALAIFFAVRMLTGLARDAYEEQARPLVDDVRGTVQSVRGSVEFVSDQAISPMIKIIAVARGVRRGMEALAGVARRGRRPGS